MDTYGLKRVDATETFSKTNSVEQGSQRNGYDERHQEFKKEEKKKEDEQNETEKMVIVKPFPSYDAFARKVTVFPFRSDGFEA